MTVPSRLCLAGFGLTNQAVAAALLRRGHEVVVVDDRPDDEARSVAAGLGLALVEAPTPSALGELLDGVDGLVATPGLPEAHPVFELAAKRSIASLSEFDLAAAWDDRPVVAITGTDGKTTVTTMVGEMLRASGIAAIEAGNNDLPLVAAIDDADVAWFVVEASSFRLARTNRWAPHVGTWLNFAEDHLDVHRSMTDYADAKAKVWSAQTADDIAVGNHDDPVVRSYLDQAVGVVVAFSIVDDAPAFHRRDDVLVLGDPATTYAIERLPRALPHDVANALAASATSMACGATVDAVTAVLDRFGPLPHRLFPVGTVNGITFYDDSKATVPHAALTAIRGFESSVLIAGGRNKGLDLSVLAEGAPRLRHVVAIGDAAPDVVAAFAGAVPTSTAHTMHDAVRQARAYAEPGDAVLLSPACASYDWYRNYGERGDDFAAEVRALDAHHSTAAPGDT